MKGQYCKNRGFTLIELVLVIIILGVLAVGISQFLQFGIKIYSQSNARDKLVSGARFAIERLNREIRTAVPNSVKSTGDCLTFTPIQAATTYTDIPVSPEIASDKISLINFDDTSFSDSWDVIVYPTHYSDLELGSGKMFSVKSLDKLVTPWQLTLDSAKQFEADSPTKRLFFIDGQVSFCVVGDELRREAIPIAKNVTSASPFTVLNATLQRNAIVKVELVFEINNEQANFSSDIQVPNVP